MYLALELRFGLLELASPGGPFSLKLPQVVSQTAELVLAVGSHCTGPGQMIKNDKIR